MFEQSLVESTKKVSTRKPMTILLSFLLQVVIIGLLVLVPLIYYDVLPAQQLMSFVTAPPPPPPAPPPPAAEQPRVVRKIVSEMTDTGQLRAPKEIPKQIAHIKEEAAPPPAPVGGVVGGVPGGIPGGTPGGVIGGIIGGIPSAAPPPPPKPTVQRIRLGGQVAQAKCVSCPMPQYPPLARQARIQGQVVLHAIIAKDGSIQQLQLVSGHPMLVSSAMSSVREWRYSPTLLNGEPVEVDTVITVNFTLSG
jgi:protein TonB